MASEKKAKHKNDDLPVPWKRIQGALWLIGLAILFYMDWIWPGILVLVAISGLFQAGVEFYLSRQEATRQQVSAAQRLAQEQANWLPATCPKCGAPVSVETVNWTGPSTADCPYCKANLRPAAA